VRDVLGSAEGDRRLEKPVPEEAERGSVNVIGDEAELGPAEDDRVDQGSADDVLDDLRFAGLNEKIPSRGDEVDVLRLPVVRGLGLRHRVCLAGRGGVDRVEVLEAEGLPVREGDRLPEEEVKEDLEDAALMKRERVVRLVSDVDGIDVETGPVVAFPSASGARVQVEETSQLDHLRRTESEVDGLVVRYVFESEADEALRLMALGL